MRKVTAEFHRLLNDERAATAIEYALIAAGVAAAIIATVNAVGVSVSNLWTSISDAL